VPRPTLLFFGAAKDIPEAAKMVTAGTASLPATSERLRACKPTAKRDVAASPLDPERAK